MAMKQIEVVAAIIRREGLYFATQRGYGEFEGMWEFPGGKIEPGEEPEGALVREIREELDVEVTVEELFCVREFEYPRFRLKLHCYFCSLAGSNKVTPFCVAITSLSLYGTMSRTISDGNEVGSPAFMR